jgi:hypothetical protein
MDEVSSVMRSLFIFALGVYRRMRTWLKHMVVDSAKVRDMSA